MKALSGGMRLAGVILLVSIVSLLGGHSLITQPAASANMATNAGSADIVANATLPRWLNRTQTACYSNQCQVVPFSIYYGVARVVLDLPTPPSTTFTIDVNSTLGPAFIEQVQLAFFNGNYNSPPAVTSYWSFNGGLAYAGVSNSGVACSPPASYYVGLVAACDSTAKLIDPLGNPSIPVGPGNSNAPSAGIMVSITSDTSTGQVTDHPLTLTATVVAPVGASVGISIYS